MISIVQMGQPIKESLPLKDELLMNILIKHTVQIEDPTNLVTL
jgi:hypothetical protein